MSRLLTEPITEKDIAIAKIISGKSAGDEVYLNMELCSGKCKQFSACCDEAEQLPLKKIQVRDGTFMPMPHPSNPQHGFIFGATGCGKSVFCANYVKQYQKLFPENPIYLVSYVDEDPSVDKIRGLIRIPLQDIVDGEISGKSIKDSLIIFDDVDALPQRPDDPPDDWKPKEVFQKVEDLRDQLLTTGRHYGVSVLVTSHLGCDFKHTKKPINESAFCVIYPKCGNFAQVDRILRVYAGLTKKQVLMIQEIPSRWIYFYKQFPNYIVSEKNVILL